MFFSVLQIGFKVDVFGDRTFSFCSHKVWCSHSVQFAQPGRD